MSKFKLLNGANLTSIVPRSRELRQLELDVEKNLNPEDRDLVVYAHHFMRLGHTLMAQKYMNRLTRDYFDVGVYKDLSRALLAWSVRSNPVFNNEKCAKTWEYFLVLKHAAVTLTELNFESKVAFNRFKITLSEFGQLTDST